MPRPLFFQARSIGSPVRWLLSPVGLTLFGAAQLADLATFLVMTGEHGVEAELNPLAITLHGNGLPVIIVAKLSVWALAAAVAAVLEREHSGLARFVIAFGIAAGALGTLSNVLTI